MSHSLQVLSWLLILLGVLGTVLPLLPGAPLIFGGCLLLAWGDDFNTIGVPTVVVTGLLTLAAIGVDFAAASLGAKRVGASRLAIVGALIGTVVGLAFGIVGIIIGPFLGAVGGELVARRDALQAGRAGFGTWLGLILGGAIKFGIALMMLALVLGAYLF